ncbi:acyl-CoA dehydrogenase [Paroceanicella profunda]|uniref:3-methylmercaptopropionyl-CoA dehydrogenase n=1 Tax=Paroceanicella profunda TaxID=2579971 RepID=A0A5B8FZ39_9RHOB|nr:acyl-CoA dehydrogenase [Paroceanicella profunda]QDL91969.1 acyl-CoA dehydrogenase [Paroceanicella profunda]
MAYRPPVEEIIASMRVIGADRLTATDLFAEATQETVEAILAEAAKLAAEVLAPLQRAGDLQGARLENGVVRSSPGYMQGYAAIRDGGWVGITADPEHGGMGLPLTLATAVGEMMSGACVALALNPLLTQGQIEALTHHASEEIRALYLPRLVSGEWTGTMNLTEAQAGSDVGALRAVAVPNGDGTYAVSGQKIFITWGDHDLTPNIVHLVLARLPDGPKGTKGISLFLVPKYIPDAEGNPGPANSLRALSLEHKLGMHGSATAVMEFDGATGWLVGAPHDGMAAMFTMMNAARIGVGVQGLGVAEAAMQKALAYALDRRQGRSLIEGGTGSIIDHADVRRMAMTMRALTATARALCLDTAFSHDMARAAAEPAAWEARCAFLTPICKAFGTDVGREVSDLGIQIHGGMGFIEETGAAQYWRDVRVAAIYEGTNGIQAMDLVARKLMDGGAAARGLLEEVAGTVADAREAEPALTVALETARAELARATDWLLDAPLNDRFAGASPYLRAFALVLGGHYLLRGARLMPGDARQIALARFHIRQLLAQVPSLCATVCEGAAPLYALDAEALAS